MFKNSLARIGAALMAFAWTTPVFAQATQLPPAEVCFQATTGIAAMIGTLGTITGGSGGTAGTYANVPLTGGSGSSATANITVSGGAVTAVVILNPGTLYKVGDVLSAASGNIGGTSGFSVPVASISINSSLAGGSVGMYVPGTLTTSQTWQNSNQTTLNANPIPLDANGCAIIYGVGTYRQILFDSLGNEVWDQLTAVAPVNPFWAGTATGTANAITVPTFSQTSGQQIDFIASATNTGSATLNGFTIEKNSATGLVPLVGGEIQSGMLASVVFNATSNVVILQNPFVQPQLFGQGIFKATSSTTAALNPYGGNLITINGANFSIPAGGVTATITSCFVNQVAAQSVSPNTLYYVYVFNNSGTLALDFSTTSHVTDSSAGDIGVEIMSGNANYALVGMVYPQAGPVLSFSGANQLVASWFNRQDKGTVAAFTANHTSTSTSPVELDTSIRNQFVTWGTESVVAALSGVASASGGSNVSSFIDFDGGTVSAGQTGGVGASGAADQIGVAFIASGLSEGFHYATMFVDVSANTGTWYGPSGFITNNPLGMNLSVKIRG